MKYRHFINGTEVYPRGDWSINYERNDGQIFFRRVLEGELTFTGDDYDFITSLDCEIAEYEIFCGGVSFWTGQFQFPYIVKFDTDSCFVVLTPEVVDEYSCIMEYYETEFQLFPAVAAFQLWDCAGAVNYSNFPAGRGGTYLAASTGSGRTNFLDYLINSNMQCSLTLRSSFMFEDNFANGDNYAAAYGTNNYITGAGNRLDYIWLVNNHDVRVNFYGSGTGCDHPLNRFTFKQFEDLLRNAFNAYWFIDENGHFRIEHIHYFDPDFAHSDFEVGRDLTTLIDRSGRSYAYRRNKYEYETGRMYDQEQWTWQHWEGYEGGDGTIRHGTDFDCNGVAPVYYGATEDAKSVYVPGEFRELEHPTPNVWTDIYWAYQLIAASGAASDIECPGWLMFDYDAATTYIRCETGLYSNANTINGHCSMANLLGNYHTYNRIFLNGTMLFGSSHASWPITSFDTAQKHKIQIPIEFPYCCEESFDPLNQVKTGLGDGEVKTATQNQHSIEVELRHEFDCD